MKGLYINHGPGSNEWFGVQKSDLDRLQRLLFEYNKLDIFKSEGLWFADQHFLRKNGISVVNFVQNKGDMVLINRGFVYWIKSLGVTVNSGWNLVGNDLEQVPLLLKRFDFNKNNDMENIINVKTFCYDLMLNLIAFPKLLNFDNYNVSAFEFLLKAVQSFEDEEEKTKNDSLIGMSDKLAKRFKPEYNDNHNVNKKFGFFINFSLLSIINFIFIIKFLWNL